MVGFRDLVGTGIAPVSKETAVKSRSMIRAAPSFFRLLYYIEI